MNFTPKGYVNLVNVFNAVGRKLYGERWTGEEVGARDGNLVCTKEEEAAIPRKYKWWTGEQAEVSFPGDLAGVPEIRPIWERNQDLRQRAAAAWNELRQRLFGGTLKALVLNRDGKTVPVPPEAWADDWEWQKAREEGVFVFGNQFTGVFGGRVLFRIGPPEESTPDAAGEKSRSSRTPASKREALNRCEKYLRDLAYDAKGQPKPKPKIKPDIRQDARAAIRGLSKHDFDNVWKKVVPPGWHQGGRPWAVAL